MVHVDVMNPDKVLFPESGIDKKALAAYYERIADVMLPHVRDRAITMHRFPDGIGADGFYQKSVPDHFPDWVRTARMVKEDGTVDHVVIDRPETLVFLANQACITVHVSLSRVDRPRHPDRMIIDLDPPDGDFAPVRRAALTMRTLFEELDFEPFVMTTGSRGAHVMTPLDAAAHFDTVRDFARDVAELAAAREPEALTVAQRKHERGERMYLDYLRNGYAQTAVAPYSVRAKPGAPVATPVDWSELADESLGSRTYTVENLFHRLAHKEDPWRGMNRRGRSLADRRETLDRLRHEHGL
jgi:bifunctional non-homologous end joining protein LigD